LIAAGAVYVGIPLGETYFRYAEYKDAMRQELRFRSNLSNDKIRSHLQLQADSLGLPEEAGDVTVSRSGNQVSVEAEYDEIIKVFGLTKAIHFQPHASDTY
jgi:hypothetical protein